MAKESRVNYDVYDVPVEARAATTTGRGWYGWVLVVARRVVNLFFLLSHARAVIAAVQTPPRAVRGKRRDVWSLVRGTGVLGLLSTSRIQMERLLTARETEMSSSSRCVCAAGDTFFSTGSKKIAILASQWHAQMISPCHCVARIASSP